MSGTIVTNGMAVLIIDDDKSIRSILSKILEREGFKVDTAQSGQEAINKLTTANYSVALIDVKLQDTNGLDLLKQLGEIAPAMAKVVLTGYPSDGDRITAMERGADYYFAKPINPEKLVEIIRSKTQEKHG